MGTSHKKLFQNHKWNTDKTNRLSHVSSAASQSPICIIPYSPLCCEIKLQKSKYTCVTETRFTADQNVPHGTEYCCSHAFQRQLISSVWSNVICSARLNCILTMSRNNHHTCTLTWLLCLSPGRETPMPGEYLGAGPSKELADTVCFRKTDDTEKHSLMTRHMKCVFI